MDRRTTTDDGWQMITIAHPKPSSGVLKSSGNATITDIAVSSNTERGRMNEDIDQPAV